MSQHQAVKIPVDGRQFVAGDLSLPDDAEGLIVFAHGSGSSRNSPRNQAVARALNQAGLGTLLIDLLTTDEERQDRATGHLRFDIRLLSGRLLAAVDWLAQREHLQALPLGLFGASTGAAAALVAAAQRAHLVQAVVSRGGRPDLAGPWLYQVQAASLFIVGSRDDVVIGLNQQALAQMNAACEAELVIVPDAGHLFEEPGKLAEVAHLAAQWFRHHLVPQHAVSSTQGSQPIRGNSS